MSPDLFGRGEGGRGFTGNRSSPFCFGRQLKLWFLAFTGDEGKVFGIFGGGKVKKEKGAIFRRFWCRRQNRDFPASPPVPTVMEIGLGLDMC